MKAQGRDSTRRVLNLIFVLRGHTFDGLRLKQIADSAKTTPSTTLKDLELLASEGLAERIPGREDCWRLSPRIVQVAVAHQNQVMRLQQQLDDFNNRYTRHPS